MAHPIRAMVPMRERCSTPRLGGLMRTHLLACAIAVAALLPASAQEIGSAAPNYTVTEIVRMNRCQLLGLYASAETGETPQGYVPGRAFDPGRLLAPARSWLLSRTLWQG